MANSLLLLDSSKSSSLKRNNGPIVTVVHPIITTIWTACAANSFGPPPRIRPCGRPGRPGYTSSTYLDLAKRAVNMIPHAPQPPWSCAASKGSSYWSFSASLLQAMRTHAATKPHTTAAQGSTTEQPLVMAANPPRRPLQTSVRFQLPIRTFFPNKVVRAAVQPESVVVTAVLPTALHCP
nr:hypothetical protein VIGAN_04315400 [Ipomoea trifida]